MLIWLYPENCVSYIQPDTLRRTHTIKPTPFPLDLFLFLLLLLLKTLPLKLFFVLWFFSSYTASCQHLSQSYRFIWWEQNPENHWHVSDTEEYCDCFSFTAMKKSWESLLTSVWTQRFKQCLKKKSRTECRHKKTHHFDKVSAHAAYNNLGHEENNESLYCNSERHYHCSYSRPAGTVSLILCKITTIT